MSRALRTLGLPPAHGPVGYRWQNTGSLISLINTGATSCRTGVSDALCMLPPPASGLSPLRHSGNTPAPTPTGDYAPSLRSPWRAASVMRHRYRHTQIGWAIIIAVIAAAAVAVPAIQAISAGPMPAAFLAVLLSLMALFATLTVVVDDTHLGFRFTLGLIGKRIALADIRHYRAVRNPWYYGWGIHLYPGGVLYNVSGLQAVEILLKGGRRLRIGTDEPDAVVRAIEGVIGAPEPLSPQEEARVQSWTKKWRTVLLGILFLVLAGIGLLAYFEEQPPKVTVTDVSFKVRGVLYGDQFPMAEITGVSLCQHSVSVSRGSLREPTVTPEGGHCAATSGSRSSATGSSSSGSASRRTCWCAPRRNTSSSTSAIRQGHRRFTRN